MDLTLSPFAPYVGQQQSILKTSLTPLTVRLLTQPTPYIIYEDKIPTWLPNTKYKADCVALTYEQKLKLHSYFKDIRSNANRVDASLDQAKIAPIELDVEDDEETKKKRMEEHGQMVIELDKPLGTPFLSKATSAARQRLDKAHTDGLLGQPNAQVTPFSPTSDVPPQYSSSGSNDKHHSDSVTSLDTIDEISTSNNNHDDGAKNKNDNNNNAIIFATPTPPKYRRSLLATSTNAPTYIVREYESSDDSDDDVQMVDSRVAPGQSKMDKLKLLSAMIRANHDDMLSCLTDSDNDDKDDMGKGKNCSEAELAKREARAATRNVVKQHQHQGGTIHTIEDDFGDDDGCDASAILPSLLSPHRNAQQCSIEPIDNVNQDNGEDSGSDELTIDQQRDAFVKRARGNDDNPTNAQNDGDQYVQLPPPQ